MQEGEFAEWRNVGAYRPAFHRIIPTAIVALLNWPTRLKPPAPRFLPHLARHLGESRPEAEMTRRDPTCGGRPRRWLPSTEKN